VISVRRGDDEDSRRAEEEVLEKEGVRKWVEEGRVRLLGSGNEEWVGISSTRERGIEEWGSGKAERIGDG